MFEFQEMNRLEFVNHQFYEFKCEIVFVLEIMEDKT